RDAGRDRGRRRGQAEPVDHAARAARAEMAFGGGPRVPGRDRRESMKRPPIPSPVPELPVADVERAQEHYRDALGFEIGWLYPGNEIGAVSRGSVAIFFRKRARPFEPAIQWIFAEDLDASYDELKSRGANIVE